MHRPMTGRALVLALSLVLAACGKDDAAQAQEDGKATGAACRHAGYGIEHCFQLNPDAVRSAMFAGWKEMNDYMRENNIAVMPPPPKAPAAHASAKAEGEEHAQGESSEGATLADAGEHAQDAHETPAEDAPAGAHEESGDAAEHADAADAAAESGEAEH